MFEQGRRVEIIARNTIQRVNMEIDGSSCKEDDGGCFSETDAVDKPVTWQTKRVGTLFLDDDFV